MVGVLISRVYILHIGAFHIVGYDESVKYHHEAVIPVGDIGIARGVHHFPVAGAFREMLGDDAVGKRIAPAVSLVRAGIEILLGLTCKIMIKIASAYYIIALGIFFLHIFNEHLKLCISLSLVGSVSRQVQIYENQLLTVIRRNPRNTVASVKVQDLLESRSYGKASSECRRQCGRLRRGRIGEDFLSECDGGFADS